MRVLVVADWFLKVAEGHAAGLSGLGDDVVLLCRDHALEYGESAVERYEMLGGLRDAGVRVLQISGRRYHPEGTRSVARAMRALRRWRPHVASVHANEDPRLMVLAAPSPVALTIHDPVPHPGHAASRWLGNATSAAWIRMADRIIVHGEDLIGQLPPGVREGDVRVVPHGIRVARRPLEPPESPAILLFGRLERYKGVELLLAAMRHLWAAHPAFRLIVAGRGEEAVRIPRHPNVELFDRYISEHEIDWMFARASVCVLPYTQASQSGVGLQAIARGVPVVVSRVGALPELAHDETLVVPPADPRALAAALDRALRLGGAERQDVLRFATERFSWPVVAQRYRRVYEELVP